ncbi:hypothetical protein BLNAU_3606 [Blattamonas nauphoetae]|uniref:Coatomer subunit zeta n=1 Tax=Blattamonas nauphoetae TaxID=2049346 RepID=A0ABQ9YCM8_9EUKA|nr:hypothetical protein BLNAU_3606 [Blattamonas nauphoetae]
MIHSIIITNVEGYIVFAQYYTNISNTDKTELNQKLFEITQFDWQFPGEQLCVIYSYNCAFCQVNDARIFIVGTEDELIMLHLLQSIQTVLSKVVFKQKITVNAIVENYPKTCLALKEMLSAGNIHHINAGPIDNILKLKAPYHTEKS